MDLHTALGYLGVPIQEKSYMFGDNQVAANNIAILHSCFVYLIMHYPSLCIHEEYLKIVGTLEIYLFTANLHGERVQVHVEFLLLGHSLSVT
jgi:hypothetical protein